MNLISIFADTIKSQLLLKLATSSIVVCCQRLCMVNVLYRKLSYHIWKLRYYHSGPLKPGGHKFIGPFYWVKIKKVSFAWLETCSSTKGMLQKSVHLRTSSPPILVWAVLRKLVNLIYIWFFLFTFAALLFVRWFGGLPVGVYNSFLLTNKYVKRSLLTKSLTRIFDFQLQL